MATNDNALSCQSELQFFELLASCIGKEADGKRYLRTHKVTAVAGSKAFSCNGAGIDEAEVMNELRNCFAIDSNGDMALRVTQTT